MLRKYKDIIIGLCAGPIYLVLLMIIRENSPNISVVIMLELVIIFMLLVILNKKCISTAKYIKKKLIFFSVLAGIGGAYFHSFTLLMPLPEGFSESFVPMFKFENYLEICFILPIIEELIFRGIVLKCFRLNYSLKVSIIFSAIIFGSLHGGTLRFLIAFTIGLLLAYVFYLTEDILYPILIHITINSWNIIVKGSNSLIRILNDKFSVMLCGWIIGILGIMMMLYSVKKIKKYS